MNSREVAVSDSLWLLPLSSSYTKGLSATDVLISLAKFCPCLVCIVSDAIF